MSRSRAAASALGRALFEAGSARTMAGFRIAFATALLVSQLALIPDVAFFYSDAGVLPNALLSAQQPDLYWSILHRIDSPWAVRLVHTAFLAVIVMVLVGYRTRLAAPILFVLVVSFRHRNTLVTNAGDQLAALVAFWMMFADSGARWSFDARARLRRGAAACRWNRGWVLANLRLQLCFIYGCSALQKLTDTDWVRGEAMFYSAALVEQWAIPMTVLMDHPALYKGATWGTLAFEILFPLLVWHRRARTWLLACGAVFHLGILVFLGLPFFGLQMLALLTLFAPWERRST